MKLLTKLLPPHLLVAAIVKAFRLTLSLARFRAAALSPIIPSAHTSCTIKLPRMIRAPPPSTTLSPATAGANAADGGDDEGVGDVTAAAAVTWEAWASKIKTKLAHRDWGGEIGETGDNGETGGRGGGRQEDMRRVYVAAKMFLGTESQIILQS